MAIETLTLEGIADERPFEIEVKATGLVHSGDRFLDGGISQLERNGLAPLRISHGPLESRLVGAVENSILFVIVEFLRTDDFVLTSVAAISSRDVSYSARGDRGGSTKARRTKKTSRSHSPPHSLISTKR